MKVIQEAQGPVGTQQLCSQEEVNHLGFWYTSYRSYTCLPNQNVYREYGGKLVPTGSL